MPTVFRHFNVRLACGCHVSVDAWLEGYEQVLPEGA
jgi:hypothetical protein